MAETPPWTLLESRKLIEDRWISLRADRVRTATGREVAPWYVLHYPDWAVVVPLTEDDRVVLIRQWRHAVGAWCLELPGGVLDATDAEPVAGARRELREETGYDAASWRVLYAAWPNPSIQTNRIHVVLATGAAPAGPTAHEDGETIEVLSLPVAEALEAAAQGRIGQAMHVGALYAGLVAAGRIRL